jgi:hypothetical protein
MTTTAQALWLAYGAEGNVVGTIKKNDDGYTVTMAGASSEVGTYPTMEVAKRALHGHLTPGADWPSFREH